MPSPWLLFDRIRALAKQHRIYQADRVYQDQSSLDRAAAGGDFSDNSVQAAILDQTNLQINRLERYKDYEQMDQTGEISLALDLYADEACLSGDTRVPLLDGTCPTIAELAEKGVDHEFWVYSYDQQQGEYVPARAQGARVSGHDVEVVKVTLDDGSCLRCTDDHLFLMNNGEFIEAKNLKTGDSLKPLYKKRRYRTKNGAGYCDDAPVGAHSEYDFIYDGKNFRSAHRWIYGHFNSDNPQIIHHDNYNGIDNTPTNLVGMTIEEHDEIHRKYGSDNHSFNPITLDEIRSVVSGWQGVMTKNLVCQACDIGERVLYRVLRENETSWSEFKNHYHRCSCCNERIFGNGWVCAECRKKYLQDHHQRNKNNKEYRQRRLLNKRKLYVAVETRNCVNCEELKPSSEFQKNNCAYSPYCNECRPAIVQSRYLQKSFNNHKVVSVEYCGIVDKVYDIEVPQYHCFAAGTHSSWVIVHNSLVDPERKHTIIIRARNRRLKLELEDFFFNTLLWDTYCRPSIRYLCKYGDMPFEILPTEHRDGVAAIRFMNVYNFTRIETRFGDLVGFFYQDNLFPQPQFLHPWQIMHLRLTSFENIYHPYGRCLHGDTLISTPSGPIAIKNLECGNQVYSWDESEKKAVITNVVAKTCNNDKELLKIKTLHHEIKCTPEHPILIDGSGYKLAKDLGKGDRVIIPEIKAINCQIKLRLSEPTNGNCIIPELPHYLDIEFAKLFGFLIGDGWVSNQTVSFALSEHPDINSRYQSILENYGLHCTYRLNKDGKPIAICCSNLLFSELIKRMGLVGKANNKNIPNWVFVVDKDIKTAFLQGYADADGCRKDDVGICLTSCNKPLLQQFRYLIKSIGYKCGKISGPFDNNSELCPSGDLKRYAVVYYPKNRQSNCLTDIDALSEAVSVNTGFAGTLRSLGYRPHGSMYELLKQRIDDYDIDTSHFKGVAWNKGGASTAVLASPSVAATEMGYVTEQILSVETAGRGDVYDIQVEQHHNFIADGVVVHNSVLDGGRKAFKQLRLMEDAALIYRITRAPEKRKFFIPVGLIPPKEVPEYMQMIARMFKRQRFYNPTTGTFDERYSPLIQEDDFLLPRRPDGSGPDIDVLPGAENLDQIADIEYFKKKMIAPTKIPFERVGIGQNAGTASEKSLSQSHSEFAKAVQWVQREVATGLKKVAIVHLALRGCSVEDLKGFDIALTATSAMEELYRIETWQTRAGVMAELKDLGWFPKEWIVTHFTDLSPDEIEELKDLEGEAASGGSGGGLPGGLDVSGDEGEGLPEDMPETAKIQDPNDPDGGGIPLDLGQDEETAESFNGLDIDAQRRVLKEMVKRGERAKARRIIETWATRLGRTDNIEIVHSSGFNHMLAAKELDGLAGGGKDEKILTEDKQEKYTIVEGLDIVNPNNNENLLVEWSVPKELRDETIKEVYDVITLGDMTSEGTEDETITEADLPETNVTEL